MTVGELLARCSSAELTDWIAYERIAGPLGDARGDFHAAMVCAVIVNAMRFKRGKTFSPKDFMPRWDRPRAQTPDEMRSFLIGLTHRLGGKVVE